MNDPRFSGVLDPRNLPALDDVDWLTAKLLLLTTSGKNRTVADLLDLISEKVFAHIALWEAASIRQTATSSTTIYTLNAGTSFDDCNGITITFDNGDTRDAVQLSSFFPKPTLEVGQQLQVHTLSQWRQIDIVSATTFKISSGGGSVGIRAIDGFVNVGGA